MTNACIVGIRTPLSTLLLIFRLLSPLQKKLQWFNEAFLSDLPHHEGTLVRYYFEPQRNKANI